MTSPAPKRRRTLVDPGPASASATPARASYRSPTKATLSRWHPALLPASRSASPRKERDTRQKRGANVLDYVLGKADSLEKDERRPDAEEGTEAAEEDDEADDGAGPGADATEDQPEAPEGARRARQDVGDDTQAEAEEEEADLPETPHGGTLPAKYRDSPPRGILFSTPRRRKRKEREEAEKAVPVSAVIEAPRAEEPPVYVEQESRLTPGEQLILEEKQATLATLEKELRELQHETREYERHIQLDRDTSADAPYKNLDELITLINKSNPKAKSTAPALPLSSLLTAFLPFSIPLPELPPAYEDEEAIPSHTPLPDTPELLTLFAPLDVQSNISTPSKPTDPTAPITQLHTLSLSSPSSLLTCVLDVIISSDPADPRHPTVDDLEIRNLSPWANREIGDWIQERAKEGDVSAIGYGLGRYWNVSLKRAQVWGRVCREFDYLVPGVVSGSASGGTTTSGGGRGKGAAKQLDGNAPGEPGLEPLSRKEIFKHLGRDSLTLQNKQVSLHVFWRLSHDWTGEVESRVSAKASFPSIWHEVDDRASLRKLPATFDRLVRKVGVLQAVQITVRLLFEEA